MTESRSGSGAPRRGARCARATVLRRRRRRGGAAGQSGGEGGELWELLAAVAARARATSTMYIENCRLNGLPSLAIAVRHLLPNLLPLIVAQFTLSFGYAIIDLASISYLGLGVQAPAADWGLMVQEGQAGIVRGYPQESLYAGILIVLLVVSFSIVGDHLNSRYEKAREG